MECNRNISMSLAQTAAKSAMSTQTFGWTFHPLVFSHQFFFLFFSFLDFPNHTFAIHKSTRLSKRDSMSFPAATMSIGEQHQIAHLTRTFNSSRVLPWSTVDPTVVGEDHVLFHKKEEMQECDWIKHMQRSWTYFRQTDETMIRSYGPTQLRQDDDWNVEEKDVYAQLFDLYTTFVRATCLETMQSVPVMLRFLSEDGDEWVLVRNVDRTFNWVFGPTKSARAVKYANAIHEEFPLDIPCVVCLALLESGFSTPTEFVPYLQSLFDQVAAGTTPLTKEERITLDRAIELAPPPTTTTTAKTTSENSAQE